MNILHLKYAVEVARIGSIKKTAEILFNTQPNLSRCIRELETSVGITIFDRTTKGMVPTPEGEHFLRLAEKILDQIEELESLKEKDDSIRKRFSISVPRVGYIYEAFAIFSISALRLHPLPEIRYNETDSNSVIDDAFKIKPPKYFPR